MIASAFWRRARRRRQRNLRRRVYECTSERVCERANKLTSMQGETGEELKCVGAYTHARACARVRSRVCMWARMRLCACARARVRASERARVRACVRASVRACERACVRAS
eukprot:2143835-Pleurochrysis_carterae.AAC.1